MAKKAILVIDPYAELGELLVQILSEDGYLVATVQSIAEARPLLAKRRFHLVITEAFGQTDQFEFDPTFLDELRSLPSNTPIVLYSTYPSIDNLHPGDFDLAGVVSKPFDIDELEQTVNELLNRA